MSNVIDNETGRPLADGKVTHIIDWCGRKIGLVRINKTHELFIPFSFFIFCWFWPMMLRKCLFTFFKSFACLALQMETIVKKITQPTSPNTKNELTKTCNEPGT